MSDDMKLATDAELIDLRAAIAGTDLLYAPALRGLLARLDETRAKLEALCEAVARLNGAHGKRHPDGDDECDECDAVGDVLVALAAAQDAPSDESAAVGSEEE